MNTKRLISTQILCAQYKIEIEFVNALNQMGLLHIEVIEQTQFVHQDEIGNLEKIIRLHSELNLNLEGIDIVFNLLEKEMELRQELNVVKNKLRLYESD